MKNKKKNFVVITLTVIMCCLLGLALIALYFNIKYPLKYKNEILKYSSVYDLNPAFVASLINAESSFNSNAVSHKGAVGLMQILPSTAEYISKLINDESFSTNNLFDPETNIKYGCFYLSYLKNRFYFEREVLCAYNAGETIVSGWLKNKDLSYNGKQLNIIPYSVTQNYVNKIMEGKKHYTRKI